VVLRRLRRLARLAHDDFVVGATLVSPAFGPRLMRDCAEFNNDC
jgi:hypothetical protein